MSQKQLPYEHHGVAHSLDPWSAPVHTDVTRVRRLPTQRHHAVTSTGDDNPCGSGKNARFDEMSKSLFAKGDNGAPTMPDRLPIVSLSHPANFRDPQPGISPASGLLQSLGRAAANAWTYTFGSRPTTPRSDGER